MLDRRRFLIGTAALAAGTALAGTATLSASTAEPSRLTIDRCMTFIDTLALMRERNYGPPVPAWVRKWATPIAFQLYGVPARRHRGTVEKVLGELSALTLLPLHLSASTARRADTVRIYFLSDQEMRRLHGNNGMLCRANTDGHRGVIRSSRVEISESFSDCLRHELMHVLGFDNHWSTKEAAFSAHSVLAHREAVERSDHYSRWDKLAIRTLYHPSLHPRMSRAEALPVARQIMASMLETEGTLENTNA